jgi:hypothetical protein
MNGADLQDVRDKSLSSFRHVVFIDIQGYDSHCSPSKQELIIFRSDYILPQYIVHYKITTGEFKYTVSLKSLFCEFFLII